MLKKKIRRVGRPRESYPLKIIPLNLDPNKADDFRRICDDAGISMSEGVRQLIDKELDEEKNVVGADTPNPCNIAYQASPRDINFLMKTIRLNPGQEPLDYYLEKKITSLDSWMQIAKKETDVNLCIKKEAMGRTINTAYNSRLYFLKEGKYKFKARQRPVTWRDLR